MLKRSLLLILLIATAGTAGYAEDAWRSHPPTLIAQHSGMTQLLIAVSPVNSRVVWAAGAGGTYVVTTDGGSHWRSGVVPGAETLQFRDVQGVSDRVAYLMSIGDNTGDFRIYKTVDGGAHWRIQFQNKTVNAFYDCFAFWTPDRGIAHSDSVNGVFPDIRTFNGKAWHSIAKNMPSALSGKLLSPPAEPASRHWDGRTHGSRPAAPASHGSWPPVTVEIPGMRTTLPSSATRMQADSLWRSAIPGMAS